MTLCKPSATSLSISTPRLIGPGCIIRQSGFKSFARALVKPNKLMYSPIPGKYSLRWRSCWMRNKFTTSAVGSTSSIRCDISTPSFSNSGGTNQRYVRAKLKQAENIRTSDATEENISHDRYAKTGDFLPSFADSVQIEQRLRWMFVCPVAGINYAGLKTIGQELRRSCRAVTQNKNVGAQGLEVARGVFERFAFLQTRRSCRDIDHVGAQPKRSQLKRGARARARFDEEVQKRFS